MTVRNVLFTLAFGVATLPALAQKSAPPPALSAIRTEELRRDLYAYASDTFRGREGGTIDELRAAAWWAEELRKAGLKPLGDDGTYFQFFSLQRQRIAPASTITLGGRTLQLWKDVLLQGTAPATVDAEVVFLQNPDTELSSRTDLQGKAVAFSASAEGLNRNISVFEKRYMGQVVGRYRSRIAEKGAAAIIVLTDAQGEASWPHGVEGGKRGLYDTAAGPAASGTVPRPPVLWLHGSDRSLLQPGARLQASITTELFTYPSVNVIGYIPGTDPALGREYLLYSGHGDHDGVRAPDGRDSIYDGADDNTSVNVAMLAVARAFKKAPARRPVLFVFHGAEERGLLGSKWYAAHPTVPLTSIIAVLNGDMIGRNHPDSAAVLGSQGPHKNSEALTRAALDANREGPAFKLDTLWDRPDHPEGWYFRSDHLPYARLGIPALMYTTLLHADYHTPRDEPDRIDYPKLRKMTEWMYRTGWKVANAARRPDRIPGFKLER